MAGSAQAGTWKEQSVELTTGLTKLLNVGRRQPAEAPADERPAQVNAGDEPTHFDVDQAISALIEALEHAVKAWRTASAAHQDAAEAHPDAADLASARRHHAPADKSRTADAVS
jgi:hypothetical protein